MRSRSARWDSAIVGSHAIVVRVDVLYDRAVIATDLNVIDGTVTLSSRGGTRGQLDIVLAEPTLIPTSQGVGILTPYGYELKVSRGVRYSDGTEELMPLGVFAVQTSEVDGASLLTRVTASDRSQQIRDARIEDDISIAASVGWTSAITTLVDDSSLTLSLAGTSYTNPTLVFAAGGDRWDAATEIARSLGMTLAFDGDGVLVMEAEPTFDDPIVWEIVEGETGTLEQVDISLERAGAYNRVIAVGENPALTAVPRGVATDDDPASATYYYGGFGKKPRFYASPFITTDAQATTAAQSILTKNLGVARALNLSAAPNPALELGDIVTVRRASLNVDEEHMVDSITLGLGPESSQRITTRARYVG